MATMRTELLQLHAGASQRQLTTALVDAPVRALVNEYFNSPTDAKNRLELNALTRAGITRPSWNIHKGTWCVRAHAVITYLLARLDIIVNRTPHGRCAFAGQLPCTTHDNDKPLTKHFYTCARAREQQPFGYTPLHNRVRHLLVSYLKNQCGYLLPDMPNKEYPLPVPGASLRIDLGYYKDSMLYVADVTACKGTTQAETDAEVPGKVALKTDIYEDALEINNVPLENMHVFVFSHTGIISTKSMTWLKDMTKNAPEEDADMMSFLFKFHSAIMLAQANVIFKTTSSINT